jgi:hypothetical protein
LVISLAVANDEPQGDQKADPQSSPERKPEV